MSQQPALESHSGRSPALFGRSSCCCGLKDEPGGLHDLRAVAPEWGTSCAVAPVRGEAARQGREKPGRSVGDVDGGRGGRRCQRSLSGMGWPTHTRLGGGCLQRHRSSSHFIYGKPFCHMPAVQMPDSSSSPFLGLVVSCEAQRGAQLTSVLCTP